MNRISIFFVLLVLVGAGCSRPSTTTDTISASHFGRVVGGDVSESPIKGGWVRPHPGPFWWDQIETSQDVYDWSSADRTVKYWQDRDQAILATLWPFAQWDQARCYANEPKVVHPFGDEQVWLMSICHVESYEEWVRNVVERYDGDGIEDMPGLKYPITHWEISHEPDVQTTDLTFFQRGPLAYEEIYRLGSAAIKSADPNATVLLAGMSGINANAIRYWRDVLLANRQWGDLGNIHSINAEVDLNAKSYRSFLDGLGYENRTFWITEAFVGEQKTDDDQTERLTLIGSVEAFANGAQKIFWTTRLDATLNLVVEMIDGFDSVERLSETSIKFEFPKKTVYALWDEAVLPDDVKGKVEVVRYDGVREKMKAKDVKADVPMFVITP